MSGVSFTTQYTGYQDSSLNDLGKKYNLIDEKFNGFWSYTMPMSLRKLIQVQLSYQTIDKNSTDSTPVKALLGDNRSLRWKTLGACTVGLAFTAVARIVRVVFFGACFFPRVIGCCSNSPASLRWEHVVRLMVQMGHELVDVCVTAVAFPLGVCKTVSPAAFTQWTDYLARYYLQRLDGHLALTEMEKQEAKDISQAAQLAEKVQQAALHLSPPPKPFSVPTPHLIQKVGGVLLPPSDRGFRSLLSRAQSHRSRPMKTVPLGLISVLAFSPFV